MFYYLNIESSVYSSIDRTQVRNVLLYRKFSSKGVEIFLESAPWNRLNPVNIYKTRSFRHESHPTISLCSLINTIITSIVLDGRSNFLIVLIEFFFPSLSLSLLSSSLSLSNSYITKFDLIRHICSFNSDTYRSETMTSRVIKYYRYYPLNFILFTRRRSKFA